MTAGKTAEGPAAQGGVRRTAAPPLEAAPGTCRGGPPSPPSGSAGLTKRYGDLEAVSGIDFEVAWPGETFRLASGPNGA